MERGKRIGLRYCGGCNPRYDRVAVVDRLKSFFPAFSFVSAEPGVRYEAVVLVYGCSARCTGISDLPVTGDRLIRIGGWEDLLPARDQLSCLLEKKPRPKRLCHAEVLALLPHREPALLLDEVIRLIPGAELTASLLVRPELPALQGHFPGDPVLPGSCVVEAAAQAASLLFLSQEDCGGRVPLLGEVRKAVFRRTASPGDRLDLHVSPAEMCREADAASFHIHIFTGGEPMAELELTLTLRR